MRPAAEAALARAAGGADGAGDAAPAEALDVTLEPHEALTARLHPGAPTRRRSIIALRWPER